jgi:hypothetical protein
LLINSIPQADPTKSWGDGTADPLGGTGENLSLDISASLAQNGH